MKNEADPRAWIAFIQAKDFTLDGGGAFDGNGQIWWETRCKVNKRPVCFITTYHKYTFGFGLSSDMPPKAIFINESSNIRVMDLKFMNPQEKHLHFERCKGVDVSNLSIIAPEDSPNTDGIHIYLTENMNIENYNFYREEKNCIVIEDEPCPQQNDAVQINGIVYKNIRGTSSTNEVIKFDCSKTVPCEAIKLENVNLSSTQGGVLKTFCVNAKLQVVGKVSPALQCH
ncbi:hypothetical protein Leryth_013215 [Lithospermum erythrorhizon]|nr:hypothetical protein Leryth_013215 [Lithospermum erythrorhizon]